ncbi:hypothetical protein HG531_010281 [Fusarium graminearum]|nr:hypothetical protein HG531_010281 [Fusarium graminearum]
MQIHANAFLFLGKTCFGLLHVLYNTVLCDKLLRFGNVEFLGGTKERALEVVAIDIKGRLVGICFVQSKGNKRSHDLLDLVVLNSLAVSLLLDKFKDSIHDLGVNLLKQLLPPLHKMQCVDVVYILFALVNLTLNPVSVKVTEKVVNVLGGDCVPAPFLNVESEQSLVGVRFALVYQVLEVVLQVIDELVV